MQYTSVSDQLFFVTTKIETKNPGGQHTDLEPVSFSTTLWREGLLDLS